MFGCSCWVASWCWYWLPHFSRLAGLVYSCDPHQCCLCATCTTSTGLHGAQSEGPGVMLLQITRVLSKNHKGCHIKPNPAEHYLFSDILFLFCSCSFLAQVRCKAEIIGLQEICLNIYAGLCREECRSQRIPLTKSQHHIMLTSASSTLIGWSSSYQVICSKEERKNT